MEQWEPEDQQHAEILRLLYEADKALREYKPNDRSEVDRSIAIALTDLDKLRVWIAHACGKIDEV